MHLQHRPRDRLRAALHHGGAEPVGLSECRRADLLGGAHEASGRAGARAVRGSRGSAGSYLTAMLGDSWSGVAALRPHAGGADDAAHHHREGDLGAPTRKLLSAGA